MRIPSLSKRLAKVFREALLRLLKDRLGLVGELLFLLRQRLFNLLLLGPLADVRFVVQLLENV